MKIIFGAKEDPRAILCHRLILSSKSDYFATLLKPTSAFKVSIDEQKDECSVDMG